MNPHDPKDLELIEKMGADPRIDALSKELFVGVCRYRYSYNFSWLGRPIIQFPEDMIAIQEIIWKTRPDLIIETGVAHGGSLIFSASLLELMGGDSLVVGVDIDIRAHNRAAIEAHPMSRRIRLIQGSSIDDRVLDEVRRHAEGRRKIMVILDSNHSHAHVLQELQLYSPLATPGAYLIVCDTTVEDMPADMFADRPWGPGDSPRTAVQAFLRTTSRFELDPEYEHKLMMTANRGGYLRCTAK
jgi:cephalosporin hydroxylase